MASTGDLLDEPVPTQDNNTQASIPDEDLPPSYETSKPRPFRASDFTKDGKKHILLAASGTPATIKLPEIITALESNTDISIRVILTDAATHFLSGRSAETPSMDSLRHLPHVESVHTDADEYSEPWMIGTPLLPLELRSWADIMLIAPLDATTLAKLANGISDNLLTSVLRAWDPEGTLNPPGRRKDRPKMLLAAPAMDSAMWNYPVTERHIAVVEEEWARAREFMKSARHVRDDGTRMRQIKVRPWAKILRPDGVGGGKEKESSGRDGNGEFGFTMMSVERIVMDVGYQIAKFDPYDS